MGLLDDAIREHLNLKRRRGADPAEVERAEREALGPVRRNRGPVDEADEPDSAPGAGSFAYDQDDDRDWDRTPPDRPSFGDPDDDFDLDDGVADVGRGSGRTSAGEGRSRPHSLGEPAGGRGSSEDWGAADEKDFDGEPFPEAPSPGASDARRPVDHSGDDTTEYHVDEALHAGEEGRNDDVLEETPEFLEDTPDHDRLWFEQRPPRDFDFDG